jgi:hypothetical protein
MAVGDKADMYARLKDNLVNWFGDDSPVLNALLRGCAETDAYIYSLIDYTRLQTRINTSTGFFLDYTSKDYLGSEFPRYPGENDDSFRTRIKAALVQEKGTKKGIIEVLTILTGRVPIVLEPWDITLSGCYDATLFYDQGFGMGMDYDDAYTGIVYAFRPQPKGFYFFSGYGAPGEDDAYFGYVDFDSYFPYDASTSFNWGNYYTAPIEQIIVITDADIEKAVNDTKVYGTKIYVYIFD